ncbi:MAG: shikimate kinase, partial [Pseudomonadota bacterium]
MGAGKSFLGAALAKHLAFNFIDLDKYIEEKEQTSIADLFFNIGEINFRNKESYYLKNILLAENTIVALGGGTPCFNNNIQYIKETGIS